MDVQEKNVLEGQNSHLKRFARRESHVHVNQNATPKNESSWPDLYLKCAQVAALGFATMLTLPALASSGAASSTSDSKMYNHHREQVAVHRVGARGSTKASLYLKLP
ncbi:hypothetical protein CYMTET_37006, partial [Cymbomonas tetramitiformis]